MRPLRNGLDFMFELNSGREYDVLVSVSTRTCFSIYVYLLL